MLNMSEDFQEKIRAQSRNLSGRITIAYDHPFLSLSSVNSTAENADSDRVKAFDGIGLSDYYNDGVFRGFQSANESDVNGNMLETLEFGFAPKNIQRMVVTGAQDEYPIDFSIKAERRLEFNEDNLSLSGTAGALTSLIPVRQGQRLFYPNAAFSTYQFNTTINLYNTSQQLIGAVVVAQVTGTYIVPQDGFVDILWEESNNVPSPFWLPDFETEVDLFVIENVTGNELIKYTYEFPSAQYQEIRLEIEKWSAPNSTAKISAFSFRETETFCGNDIITMDITEEIEPQGGTVFGTAIAKQAEIKLSNFRNEFKNDAFFANRVFYPEVGVNTGVFEYAPMGIYYTTEWELSDDRYFLKIKGLDAIGYILNQEYEMSFPTNIRRYYESWVENLLTQTLPTYNMVIDDSDDTTHDIKYRIDPLYTSELKTRFDGLNVREILNQFCFLTAMALAEINIVPIIYTGALYYMTTSKYKNEIILLLKKTTEKPIESYTRIISNDLYFNAKNYRNENNLVNSFKLVALNNEFAIKNVDARISEEGLVQKTFTDIKFVATGSDAIYIEGLTALYKNQQSEVETRWRGNPSFELGDDVSVQIARRGFPIKTIESEAHRGYLVANHYKFTGGLQCTSRVKVLKTEEVLG